MSSSSRTIGLSRDQMAERAAQDIPDGSYVNLGIGIPELVASHVPEGREFIYHTENGLLGMGPSPAPGEGEPELINAGKKRVTALPGAAYFHHADSFTMIRGGHLDLCVLGALQVSESGDLANWSTGASDAIPAVGGAMDLVAGVKTIFVITQHVTRDGQPKLVRECTYPLTSPAVVDRIYTNLAVIDVTERGFQLVELAPEATYEYVAERTGGAACSYRRRPPSEAEMNKGSKTTKTRSAELYRRALKILPGGVSRNTVLRKPHPAYVAHASGCRVVDIEGFERIDFANNMASLIHGHADPDIVAAVHEQMKRGSAFTMATEVEIDFAEHLRSRCESLEQLRFVNSGTEAVMGMLKAARAFTGRPKIAKVEGAYHGTYDFAEVSQTAKPTNWGDPKAPSSVPVAHGTPASVLESVIVLPFNDPERATSLLDRHKDEIACVILDPMPHRVGLVPADPEYVRALRKWTQDNRALLAFDEVITFRLEHGGYQERYDFRPDLTALGKIIGGGFPVGAIAGRADVLDVMNPLSGDTRFPHSGTFSANPVTMTAGLTAMRKFDHEAVARLNSLTLRAVEGIRQAFRDKGVPGCVTGGGSMFRVHFKPEPPKNRREAYRTPEEDRCLDLMLDHLFDAGFLVINTCSATLSTAMSEEEIDALVGAMADGFAKIRAL